MPDPKPDYFLKNLNVEYISLVDAGANKKQLVYKAANHSRTEGPEEAGSSDSFSKQMQITKTDEEKRLVYCVVYSPDEVDAQGHAMKSEEIEKAAHNFLFEGRVDKVDKQHDRHPDEGRIVESYIIGKSDSNFPEEPEGSWAVVIKVLDDDTWEEVKKGYITGVSMQGLCTLEEVEKADGKSESGDDETTKSMFRKILDKLTGTPVQKDFTDRLMHKRIRQALWAFEEEVNEQLNDEEVEDKKAAVLAIIADFEGYVSNLSEETTKQFKKSDMSEENKNKAEEPEEEKETTDGEEPSDLEKSISKAVGNALDEKLDPIEEKVDGLSKRLEKVEKASPGSKQEKGEEEEEVEKGHKGIPIFGSGPEE